jgi:hypothetical protein
MDKQKLLEELKGIRRIVINTCHGGFGLSEQAVERYKQLTGQPLVSQYNIPRDDPYLVKIVNELGKHADGVYAELKVVEIPADVGWEIDEYDGKEWVAEKHRIWQ